MKLIGFPDETDRKFGDKNNKVVKEEKEDKFLRIGGAFWEV